MGTEIKMEAGCRKANANRSKQRNTGTRISFKRHAKQEPRAWLNLGGWSVCLIFVYMFPFLFFICPRKASSQGRNLMTILSYLRMCLKRNSWKDDKTALLSCCEHREWIPLILSPATPQRGVHQVHRQLSTWSSASPSLHRFAGSKLTFFPAPKSDTPHVLSPPQKGVN